MKFFEKLGISIFFAGIFILCIVSPISLWLDLVWPLLIGAVMILLSGAVLFLGFIIDIWSH